MVSGYSQTHWGGFIGLVRRQCDGRADASPLAAPPPPLYRAASLKGMLRWQPV